MNAYDDLDETARVVLMESPECSLMQFAAALREVHGKTTGVSVIGDLWRRYRGWDGRVGPTHDVETGGRLVGRR